MTLPDQKLGKVIVTRHYDTFPPYNTTSNNNLKNTGNIKITKNQWAWSITLLLRSFILCGNGLVFFLKQLFYKPAHKFPKTKIVSALLVEADSCTRLAVALWRNSTQSQRAGSAAKGTCCQVWWPEFSPFWIPEFNPCKPHHRMEEPTPPSCSLTFICAV